MCPCRAFHRFFFFSPKMWGLLKTQIYVKKTYLAGKKKRLKAGQGHIKHVCKNVRVYNSQKRRGHLTSEGIWGFMLEPACTAEVSYSTAMNIGCLRCTKFLFGLETCKYYHETGELPNPRKIRLKVAFGPLFPHNKYFFVDWFYVGNRFARNPTNQILRKHPHGGRGWHLATFFCSRPVQRRTGATAVVSKTYPQTTGLQNAQ